jgi:hypothetical protein
MEYTKAKDYTGKPLKGLWTVTRKVDGVRAFFTPGGVVSRAGKPLYNLDHLYHLGLTDVEVFCGSWEESSSRVRTKNDGTPVEPEYLYSLSPVDSRLMLGSIQDPSPEEVYALMQTEVDSGHEGIVLRQVDKWIKVKPTITHDVPITGIQPGTGKHDGRMGALLTPMGKVGTGFTDKQRELDWQIGQIIEVEAMGLTPAGKFRHPRFIRVRFDKGE